MIPDFPNFKPIELADRQILEDYLRDNPPLTSEFTFTNIFIWRKIYNYKISKYNNGFLILAEHKKSPFFLQPQIRSDYSKIVDLCLDCLKDKTEKPYILRVAEDFVEENNWDNTRFDIQQDRDNFDYVYSTAELIDLKGEKFHDKKNLLNQFIRRNHYKYLSLKANMIDRCLEFIDEWCDVKDCQAIEGLDSENDAIRELLSNFTSLSARGGVIELDGRIVALTLGEPLNKNTFVIHIEKAKNNITGLYQAINWEFLRNQVSGFKFVNREQDLGVTGLRKTKMSYNPIRMIKKYAISPKKNK